MYEKTANRYLIHPIERVDYVIMPCLDATFNGITKEIALPNQMPLASDRNSLANNEAHTHCLKGRRAQNFRVVSQKR